ncbi:MAG: S10 family peptidase [Steroidobacteraceae bacterium]
MLKSLAAVAAAFMGIWGVAYAAQEPPKSADSHAEAPGDGGALMRLCHIDVKGDLKDEWRRLPVAESSVTEHHFSAGAKPFDYTATAGTLIVRDDDDKPIASLGYVAYTARGGKAGELRPITFAFNGGPGSSSLWLHMGVLGPRRVVVADPGPTPSAPYRTVENQYGLIDKSDLVMIDPVGTGLSHAVCNHKDDEFFGVDPDIDSISRFIAQYVSDNNRWTSPKYLLGESYGTTRGAAIVNYLRARRSLEFNGLILVSVATDLEAIFAELPGNDRPYSVYLPGYAAVAWYQHVLPHQPAALEPFLAEVRAYAMGAYTAALLKGDALSDAERDAVAAQLHEYTGLSSEYLKFANLRVSEVMFAHELLKSERKTIGRLDGRFVGPTQDPLAKEADYDPQLAAIGAAFTAAFLDYYHGELKFGQGKTYFTTNFGIGEKWKLTHKTDNGEQPIVNSDVDLAQALVQDVNLKVLVLCGYYDLATPFSATEYVMAHLGVPQSASARIKLEYYEAGHMMYVNPASIARMKKDLDDFIDSTDRL